MICIHIGQVSTKSIQVFSKQACHICTYVYIYIYIYIYITSYIIKDTSNIYQMLLGQCETL